MSAAQIAGQAKAVADAAEGFLNLTITRYLSAVALTLVLYDHILTLREEAELIWPARLSIVKLLFLFNRYLVIIGLTIGAYQLSGIHREAFTDAFCRQWIGASAYFGLISLAVSNFLLLLRVYAMYEGSRQVLVYLLLAFVLSYVATFVIATMGLTTLLPGIQYSTAVGSCVATSKPIYMAAIWVAPIVFELLIFGLTARKAWEHREAYQKSPLLRILYRDAGVFFVVIIFLRLFNLVIWVAAPISLLFLGVYIIWGLVTVLISRLLLNLRETSSDEDEVADDKEAQEIAVIPPEHPWLEWPTLRTPKRPPVIRPVVVEEDAAWATDLYEMWPAEQRSVRSRRVDSPFGFSS